jgi:RHS repeat-associated protein
MNQKGIIAGLMLLLAIAMVFPVAADSTAVGEQKNFQTEKWFIGAATHYVPIETFEVPGGLALNLALSYSSFGADQLGLMPTWMGSSGWNLAGANDRVVKVGQNRYVLIHNRVGYDLVWTSKGWQTNPENNKKITKENNGWSVIDEYGTISYYGRDVDESDLHEAILTESGKFKSGSEYIVWYKDTVEDVNGNVMKYHYTKYIAPDGHEYSVLPEKIECCFDKAGALIGNLSKEVIFNTSEKNVEDIYKTKGYWEDRRLDAVEMRINGKPLRKYVLSYDQNNLPAESSFKNRDFETGDLSGWESIIGTGHDIKIYSANGNFFANMRLGSNLGRVQMWQEVAIPKEAAILRFGTVVKGYGDLTLKVYFSNKQIYSVKTTANSARLEKQTVDLRNYAGQKGDIIFRAENSGEAFASGEIYIDDVSLGVESVAGFQILKSVTELGSDGTSFMGTMPPIAFQYSENLLTKFLNGYGGEKSFEYEEYLAHTKEGGYEENKRHRVIKINEKDGLGSVSTTLASYKNDAGESTDLSVDGEFWGHGKVSVTLPSGETIVNDYCQTDECKGMLIQSKTLGNDGKTYSATVNKIESRITDVLIPENDQVVNPGFESGEFGWKEDRVLSASVSFTGGPHNGISSARLSASNGARARIIQNRIIAEDIRNLTFWARYDEFPEDATFGAMIKDGDNYLRIDLGPIINKEWTRYELDVSSLAGTGRAVDIIFSAVQSWTDGKEVIVYVDDVLFTHRTSIVSFPYVSEIREYNYNDIASKMTLTTFARDEFGNVIDAVQYGEYNATGDVGTDRREIKTEYINDLSKNILGAPKHRVVSGFNINDEFVVQRESWMFYDNQEYGNLAKGQLTKTEARKDNNSNITIEQGYDGYGNVNWTIDAVRNINPTTGHTTDVEFIGGVYPNSSCNALNQCSSIGYDELIRPINFTDINGQSTLIVLDNFGRAIAEVRPSDTLENPTSQTVYSDIADFANGTYPYILTILKDGTDNGLRSYQFFDGFGNVIQTKTEGVNESEWLTVDQYYLQGRLERISVPYTITTSTPEVVNRKPKDEIGIWTVIGYDPVGRQNLTTKPDGTFTETVFGLWMKETYDALRHKMAVYTDGLGMTTKVENYLGNSPETYQLYATTASKYNTGTGELVKLTDPAGNEQRMEHNLLGWKIWMHDPNFGNLSYNHNNNGIGISQTDAKNQTINYTVDLLDRITRKESPGQVDTIREYDNCANGKGRLCMISGGDKKYKIIKNPSYDERGRTINVQLTINDKSWNISSGFDSIDRVVNTTYPDGEIVTVRHNKAGFVDSPDGILPAIQSNLYGEYPYLKDVTFWQGKPESYVYGNGRMSSLEYNDRPDRVDSYNGRSFTHRLIRTVVDGGVQDLGYGHDIVGNVVSVTDRLNSNNSANYTLDDLSRLIRALSGMYGDLKFGYNNVNNIIIKDGLSYTYPASGSWSVRPNAPTITGIKNFSYDANGNMIDITANRDLLRSFVNNPDNMVIRINNSKGVYGLYTYLDITRIAKTENGITTFYVNGIYEEEYWPNGTRKSATKYYNTGDTTAIRINQTVSSGFNETLRFVHKDNIGSATTVADATGNPIIRIGYDPYGKEVSIEEKKEDREIIKFRFAGLEKDTTGLYCTARCYNPMLGMFQSPDPNEGPNRYSYANNNPVNMIDPTGNFVIAAAAIPYIAATLPTITLVASAWIGYNWNEGGADVMSFAMPGIGPGKAKIAKKVAEDILTNEVKKEVIEKSAEEVTEKIVKKVAKKVYTAEEQIAREKRFALARGVAATADGIGYEETKKYLVLDNKVLSGGQLTIKERIELAKKIAKTAATTTEEVIDKID